MVEIKFGDKITCKVTKRVGVVYGIAKYLYDADQFLVLFDGEKKTEWVSSPSVDFGVH